jgi:hypothetical protein
VGIAATASATTGVTQAFGTGELQHSSWQKLVFMEK